MPQRACLARCFTARTPLEASALGALLLAFGLAVAALALWPHGERAVYSIIAALIALLAGALYALRQALARQTRDAAASAEREALFRATFEQAAIGFAHISAEARILRANAQLGAMLGRAPASLVGRRMREMSHPDDVALTDEPRARLYRGEIDQYVADKRYVRADGETVHLRLTVALAEDPATGARYEIAAFEDVTHRHRTEGELRRFRAALDTGRDAVYIVSRRTMRIVDTNAAASRMLGRTRAELIGEMPLILFEPGHMTLAELEAVYDGMIADPNQNAPAEMQHLSKDGRWILVEVRRSAIHIDGETYITVVARDIGLRRAAENALRESEERYRKLVEASPDAIYVLERHRFVFANPAAVRLFGAGTTDELLGRSIFELMEMDHHDNARRRLDRLEAGAPAEPRAERTFRRLDGVQIHVEVVLEGVDYNGRRAVQVVARDIGDRKRLERERESLLERMQLQLERMPIAYLLTDEHFQITYFNPAAERVFGYTEEEMLGRTVLETFIPSQRRREAEQRVQRLRSGEFLPAFVGAIVTKDGRERLLDWVNTPLHAADGKFLGVMAMAQDVTERVEAEARLRESEERLAYALRGSQIAIFDWTVRTDTYYMSPRLREMLRYPDPQALTSRAEFMALLHPDDGPGLEAAVAAHFEYRAPYIAEYRLRCADGSYRWLGGQGQATWDDRGRVVRFSGSIADIHDRKLAEQHVHRLLAEQRTFFDNPVIGVCRARDRRIIRCNETFARMFGYTVAEMEGQSTRVMYSSEAAFNDARDAIYGVLDACAHRVADVLLRRKDGSQFWGCLSIARIGDADARDVITIVQDISDRKEAEKGLAQLAHFDPLTGLPNRTLFRDRLTQAIARAERKGWQIGVLFVDLDHFKWVNDTLGHSTGDMLLKRVGEQLAQSVRAEDTVARLGGDEFAIIMPDMGTVETARLVARRILDRLAQPVDLAGQEVVVGGSIGITVYPNDANDPETLLKNADAAMYSAKEAGRNGVQFFTAAMNKNAARQLALEKDLRHALANAEFELHYQPRSDVSGVAITGMEALLRWRRPDGTLVPPGDFIPALEDSGLIVQVGDWVVKAACMQMIAWRHAGLAPPPVAVNVSARQFRGGRLVESVSRALDSTGLEPEFLELEITETLLVQTVESTLSTLNALRALGVRVAVDDFGTGYSSLAYLKRLPIDIIKIDRSFVKDLPNDPNDVAIVTAIVAVARALGYRVVAEGVETMEQLLFLESHDCDEVQGFLLSRPLPPEAFAAWLTQRNALAAQSGKRLLSATGT